MKATSQTTNLSGDDAARMVAASAAQQLQRSERGSQALADFVTLLDNGGYGLDNENWAALTILCRIGAAGKAFAIGEHCSRGQ
jgi:hypothetical protein